MPRLFIALPVSDAIRHTLGEKISELSRLDNALKTVSAENLHLTLKFIGETDRMHESALIRQFSSIPPAEPLPYAITGLGAFPSPDNASVIWCGLKTEMKKLMNLKNTAESAASGAGFSEDRRAFQAHITLARLRRGKPPSAKLIDCIKSTSDLEFGRSSFSSIILFESQLTKKGPVYTKIAEKILA